MILVLAIPTGVQTMPRADRLGSSFAPDDGDAVFLMWVMRHETNALTNDPSDLFQGNIYFPRRDTIAWSDNVLAYVPVFALVSAVAGGNPILAFNVVLFLAYLAGGLAVYLLAREVLRHRGGALVAALLFALAPYRGVALSHAQLAGFFGVVLALFFLVRLCRRGLLRDGLGVGASAAVTWYTTSYYAVLLAAALPVFLLTWLAVTRTRGDRRLWAGLLAAGLTAAALVAPTIGPYFRLERDGVFERRPDEVLAPTLDDFLDVPPSVLYADMLGVEATPTDQGRQYPGAVLLALVGAGILVTVARGRREAQLAQGSSGETGEEAFRRDAMVPLLMTAAVGVAAMVGPAHGVLSLPYDALRAAVPGFASIRDVGRFWLLPVTGLALAAGWGLVVLEQTVRPRLRPLLVAGVVVLAVVELLHRPLSFASLDLSRDGLAANTLLSQLPHGVVTEVPAPLLAGPAYPFVAAPRQYRSLLDGKPRLEGYSGNAPTDFAETQAAASAFPRPDAVQLLRSYGVRYVVVHGGAAACDGEFAPDEMATIQRALLSTPGVERILPAGRDVVVELTPRRGQTTPEPVAPVFRPRPACPRH